MPQRLSEEIKQLLDRPNFAHLATLMPDGSPQSVPVWVAREGDRVLVCTGEGSLIEIEKARYAKLPFQHTPPTGA